MNTLLSALPWLATQKHHCACSDATRLVIGPLSIPVGPITVVFVLVALVLLPALIATKLQRRREAKLAQQILSQPFSE